MPASTTLHDAFKRLDVASCKAALQARAALTLGPTDHHLVFDGKALRAIHGEELPRVRLVALYAPAAGLVLAQAGVGPVRSGRRPPRSGSGRKQEAELGVAPRLLQQVRPLLGGRLVSGDALYCQQALCRQIVQAGGGSLFAVTANQPDRLDDVALLFRQPPPGERFLRARTVTKYGGLLEIRRLRASAGLAAYLWSAGWPAVGRVLEVATTVRWPSHPARPRGGRCTPA